MRRRTDPPVLGRARSPTVIPSTVYSGSVIPAWGRRARVVVGACRHPGFISCYPSSILSFYPSYGSIFMVTFKFIVAVACSYVVLLHPYYLYYIYPLSLFPTHLRHSLPLLPLCLSCHHGWFLIYGHLCTVRTSRRCLGLDGRTSGTPFELSQLCIAP